jgi:hypothetical protein
MRNTNAVLHEGVWSRASVRSADALGSKRPDAQKRPEGGSRHANTTPRSIGLLERIDRWFWRQAVRDRERYLAGSQTIFELEERMRHLERIGSRYYW